MRTRPSYSRADQVPAPLLAPTTLGVATQTLKDGDAGTEQTIGVMLKLASGTEGAANPYIRELAINLTRGLGARDYFAQMQAIYDFVKSTIEFRGEYSQTVQSPVVTLQLQAGQCDDQVVLLGALLMSIGFAVRPVTVAGDQNDPDTFSHVYLEAYDRTNEQWVPLDSTVPSATPGWQPRNVFRRKAWETWGAMQGMGDAPAWESLLALGIQDAVAPLAQGEGAALANQGHPSFGLNFGGTSNLNAPAASGSGISPWLVIGGGVVLLFAFHAMGGRR